MLLPTLKLRMKLNGIAPYNAKGFRLSFRLTDAAKYKSIMQKVSILFMKVWDKIKTIQVRLLPISIGSVFL